MQRTELRALLLFISIKTQVRSRIFQLNPFLSISNIDGVSKNVAGQYENFAKENKGMFRSGAIDCNDYEALCTKEKAEKFPLIRVYPAFPTPT